jgi:hyperosmotically inducible protein
VDLSFGEITNVERKEMMKVVYAMIVVSMLGMVAISACDKPGPAENAGRKIDQTLDNAGKNMGTAADKVERKMDAQSEKAGVAIEDTEITAKIKAAIFAEPGLKTLQISVDTVKGMVTLSGSVDSAANKARANALAGAVAGVKSVDNKLVSMPPK